MARSNLKEVNSEMEENQTPESTPAKSKTEYTSVTMTDGRVVQFAGKRKLVKEVLIGDEGAAVRFDFVNGETRLFTLPQSLLLQFAAHGASQKIGDEAAGVTDVDDIVVAIDSVIDRLSKGDWGKVRAAGDGFNGASIVIKAICEATGKTVDFVKAFLQGKIDAAEARGEKLTRNELYASFRNPASKTGQIIARLEQEKLAKSAKVNADDLLGELDA